MSTLDFERTARRDFRMWLGALCGGLMCLMAVSTLLGSGPMVVEDAPLWMSILFLVAGLAMAGGTLVGLIANTSRGCRVDTTQGTLTWWQMRFAHQALPDKASIPLADIDRIIVDTSSDGVSIKLYDTEGTHREGFGEVSLPPDYDAWLTALVDQHPHIVVERK